MVAVIALAALLHAGQAGAGGYGPAYGPPGMGPGMAPGMGYGPMGYGVPMPFPAYPAYGPPVHGPRGPAMPIYGPPLAPGYDASHHAAPGGGQVAPRQSGGSASPASPSPEAASRNVASSGHGGSTVAVSGMRFSPATITVKQGEKVTWDFTDAVPHTVTSRGGEFASARLSAGATFGHTFDQPGEYQYYCALHPSMAGKVIVEE